MKAVREITVTREEIEMIKNFFEVCAIHDIEDDNRLDFLEAIACEDKEWYGIDIVIKG